MVAKKVFVTGIAGQDGAYLSKFLLDKGYDIYGLVRKNDTNFENLSFFGVKDKINYIYGDMADEASLINAVKSVQPDEIYNLAAHSFVGSSWEDSKITAQVNSLGTLYLLNAMKFHCPSARFYQASTCEMFGDNSVGGVQNEQTPFIPKSPYAISKLYAYWITRNYRESYALFCCNGILFNHESPIRGKEYITRKITTSVARIKLGIQKKIKLGNIESKRDWGFAGDYVEAMWLMLQQSSPKDYVVATGELHSISDLLDVAFNRVGISDWNEYIEIDSKFKRPIDVSRAKGDASLAKKELGWKAKVGFKELIEMMVDSDLKEAEKEILGANKKKAHGK